jgi:hypothetical protein
VFKCSINPIANPNTVYSHSYSLYGSTGLWTLADFFSFLILYTVGRAHWTGDQPVARPLPTHRATQTQNQSTDIHASNGIRTNDPNVRAGEDGSCLRPCGHCDQLVTHTHNNNFKGDITAGSNIILVMVLNRYPTWKENEVYWLTNNFQLIRYDTNLLPL